MEKNVSRKDLANAIVKFIKDESKKMNERGKSMEELRIFYSNWVNGARKWVSSVITLGGDKYEFTDKEVTEIEFINLLKDALKASGVDGKVFYDEVKNWYNVVVIKQIKILFVDNSAHWCCEYWQIVLTILLQKWITL